MCVYVCVWACTWVCAPVPVCVPVLVRVPVCMCSFPMSLASRLFLLLGHRYTELKRDSILELTGTKNLVVWLHWGKRRTIAAELPFIPISLYVSLKNLQILKESFEIFIRLLKYCMMTQRGTQGASSLEETPPNRLMLAGFPWSFYKILYRFGCYPSIRVLKSEPPRTFCS